MKEKILDAAEMRIRAAGYHGFSFREIATDVGIKSSSVHYHYPTKVDMAAATARRYTQRFQASLGDPGDARSEPEKLEVLRQAFRHAMAHDELMCLCGMLAAEVSSLPEPVHEEAAAFFVGLRDWIEVVVRVPDASPRARALQILSRLEGALLVARALRDLESFDLATAVL